MTATILDFPQKADATCSERLKLHHSVFVRCDLVPNHTSAECHGWLCDLEVWWIAPRNEDIDDTDERGGT